MAERQRPLILVTNDDGVDSPGILAAAVAASTLGDVLLAAPAGEQTAMGRSYPKTPSTGRIFEHRPPIDIPNLIGAFSIEGSPAQVVSYAILELSPRTPDLCISGVNFGENLGTTLTGSGTLGAAFEADSYDIPSLAISLQVGDGDTLASVDWTLSQRLCERFGGMILTNGLPSGVGVLNINVPRHPRADVQIRRTMDARQPFWVFRKPARPGELSEPAKLPVESEIVSDTLEPDSDIQVLIREGHVSVTPIVNRLGFTGAWDDFPSDL